MKPMLKWISRLLAGIALALSLTGCVNLYVRCPGTPSKITTVYQSTQAAAALSYVVMFPQVMSSEHETFMWANLWSVPLGLICMCDIPFEALIDTICYPYDVLVAKDR